MDFLSGYAVIHITCLLFWKGLLHIYEGSRVEFLLTRALVIRIASYPDRLDSLAKSFLVVFVLHLFMA